MKEYDITITETLEKVVSVTAASKEEAEEKVRQGYYNSEYVLYAEDFTHVDFKAGDGRDIAHEAGKIDVLMVRPGEHPQEYQVGTELVAVAGKFLLAAVLVALAAGGICYVVLQEKKKRQAAKESIDPDADYREDEPEIELPLEEPEEDETDEAIRKAYQTSDGYDE